MLNPTKSNLISSKLEAIRSLSETISESDLTLIVQEKPDSEVIANSAVKSKPKLDKKDLRTLGIVSLPDFMLDRSVFASDLDKVKRFRSIKKLNNSIINQKIGTTPLTIKEVRDFAIEVLGVDKNRFFGITEVVVINRITKIMLSRHPHQTLKVYFDFEKKSLTSVPDKGDCLEISTISIGYRNGHYGKLTQKMIEGKSFKEALVEIIKFDLKQTYLKLSQLESFTFKDYRQRKVPLSLVDKESVEANLRRWEISSIQSLLMDRSESDKQIIAELVKEMILDSSKSLYLWK